MSKTDPGPGRLAQLARATPADRERYVDLLRAFSICVVVLGHWLIASIYWRDGRVTGENALDSVPGLWIATWLLQVMPVFFFVGGFSNLASWDSVRRKGGGYAVFLRDRVLRLLRPTGLFLAVWVPLSLAADLITRLSDRELSAATTLLTRPLWFIGIYLIVILLAPAMIAAHKRFGVAALLALVAGAALVDSVAIGLGVTSIGYVNFAFVWLFAHQMGFFYADGRLTRLGRGALVGLIVVGLGSLIVMTAAGPYSPSMVGLVNERSNTNPPTLAIVALTGWQVALAMMLRSPAARWLGKLRPWMAVIFVNGVIMTLFLWHQTAMILTVLTAYPLGFPQPATGSMQWWALRPFWVALLAVWLSALVLVFGRFERGAKLEVRGAPTAPAAFAGAVLILVGILGFAVSGMDRFASPEGDNLVFLTVNPLQNTIAVLIGARLVNSRGRSSAALGVILMALASWGLAVPQRLDVLSLNTAGSVLLGAIGLIAMFGARAASLPERESAQRRA